MQEGGGEEERGERRKGERTMPRKQTSQQLTLSSAATIVLKYPASCVFNTLTTSTSNASLPFLPCRCTPPSVRPRTIP